MGIIERKEREKERRFNEILDAAERVFFEKGRQNATMEDVAAEAELSTGTIYFYFKSKTELYLGIHLRGLQILKEKFQEAVQDQTNGLAKVKSIGEAYYQFYEEYPNYFDALIYFESHEIDTNDENSVASNCVIEGHKTLEFLIESIQSGIADGSIRADIDPIQTAIILWGQSSGVIQLISLKGKHLIEEHNIDLKILMTNFYDQVYYSLKK